MVGDIDIDDEESKFFEQSKEEKGIRIILSLDKKSIDKSKQDMLFDIEEKQIKHKDVTNKTKDSLF
jgi:hypothetical protein